jgi:hypothetical protein
MAKNAKQQAAIAIAMKKAGKKPKSLTKAQKGISVKPTADSTAYYSNLSKKYFDKAASVRNAPYDGRLIKEQSKERLQKENEYNQKAFKAIDNQLRQSRKGKPGYDKNGFPIKKTTTKKKG